MALGTCLSFEDQKKQEQTLDPKCRKFDLYVEMDTKNWGNIFSKTRRPQASGHFYPCGYATKLLGSKSFSKKAFSGTKTRSIFGPLLTVDAPLEL